MNHQLLKTDGRTETGKSFQLSNLNNPQTKIDLEAGQSWRLKGNRRHQTLLCLKGSIWVTQKYDINDYVLNEGDAFVVTQPGLVLVWALKPARIGYTEGLDAVPFKGRFAQTVFN